MIKTGLLLTHPPKPGNNRKGVEEERGRKRIVEYLCPASRIDEESNDVIPNEFHSVELGSDACCYPCLVQQDDEKENESWEVNNRLSAFSFSTPLPFEWLRRWNGEREGKSVLKYS